MTHLNERLLVIYIRLRYLCELVLQQLDQKYLKFTNYLFKRWKKKSIEAKAVRYR